MSPILETIQYQEEAVALIIRHDYKAEGVQFLTPGEYSQQLAYMHHPAGKQIDAHIHNEVHRSIRYTQEVLVIKKGRLRVDFYNADKEYFESRVLEEGDIILLIAGGHGFEVLEEIEMIEIKQGPYAGEGDKTRFPAVEAGRVIIK